MDDAAHCGRLAFIQDGRVLAQGTIERFLTTPVRRADILVGYLLGFPVFASLQSVVILLFTILALRVD